MFKSEASHLHQAHFKFYIEKIKKWYEEAVFEKKKQVEKFHQKFKDDLEDDRDPKHLLQ